MADFASGTWNMVDSHNFDEYMKAVGKYKFVDSDAGRNT